MKSENSSYSHLAEAAGGTKPGNHKPVKAETEGRSAEDVDSIPELIEGQKEDSVSKSHY